MIKKCSCEHKYQDRKYGYKNRVMNKCEGSSVTEYRCTVCGTKRT